MMRSPYHLGMRKREATGFVVLCLLLGSFWIPKQVLVGEMPMLLVAAIWTWAVTALALAAAVVLRVRRPRLREWRALFVVSLLMLVVPQSMMYLALRHMQFTPLMAETLRAGGPLFLVTMTPFLKSKSVPRSAVHWMIVGFGGVLLLFDQALQIGWQNAPGIAVAVGALMMASGGLLYAKRTLQHVSPVLGTGLLLVLPSIVLVPLAVRSLHAESVMWTSDMVQAMTLLCGAGVVGCVLAMWLMQRTDPYRLTMVRVAVPMVMMAESWWMLGGRPRLEMIIAAALMALSVTMVLRTRDDADRRLTLFVHEERRRSYTEPNGSLNVHRRRGE
jgi:drug/metabolite transporter (DMT)-like permease